MKSLYESITQSHFTRREIGESITRSRFTRREIGESILDTDDKIKSDAVINGIYNRIKDILIDLYGPFYEICNNSMPRKGRGLTREILFKYNNGIYKTFADAIQALKKELNKIDGVEFNYKICPAYKILRNFTKDNNSEVVVWEIFWDDQKILEFAMDDLFVNKINPTSGLHYEFIVTTEYQSFVDLF